MIEVYTMYLGRLAAALMTPNTTFQLECNAYAMVLTAAGYVPWNTGGSEKDVPQYRNSLHIAGCEIPLGTEGLNYITLTEEEESARS